ncbi:MAG: asparaginase [Micromonosporaceae bacterium]|jgi:L-asparaginase
MTEDTPRVVVVGLGGTIAMTGTPTGGAVPALSPSELLAAVPGLEGFDVDVVDLRRVPGASVRFADLTAVRQVIASRLASGADGIVVTQGTDTIEETSYLLDLTYAGSAPVVVTGAMRNASLAGADGPANLLAAVRTAADPRARDQGVLVVFADEIHAARRVRKSHSTSPGAFRSPDGGPLGYVVEGRPVLLGRLTHRTVVPVPDDAPTPRVGLVVVTLDDDGELLRAAAERYDGLVVAGFGVGHVPEHLVSVVSDVAARIPVVLASRTGAGSVLAGMYAFPGSEADLLSRGLLRAGFLDALKARILLRTLLQVTTDRETIAAAFAAAGGYADPAAWPWPTGG